MVLNGESGPVPPSSSYRHEPAVATQCGTDLARYQDRATACSERRSHRACRSRGRCADTALRRRPCCVFAVYRASKARCFTSLNGCPFIEFVQIDPPSAPPSAYGPNFTPSGEFLTVPLVALNPFFGRPPVTRIGMAFWTSFFRSPRGIELLLMSLPVISLAATAVVAPQNSKVATTAAIVRLGPRLTLR